ncbi:MAG: YihY/virulence factor BrkB family protein [Acidobacteria bacterium]|nr:YihY/virulence factor BrkB family protein [Acidobacteriota bacterium]
MAVLSFKYSDLKEISIKDFLYRLYDKGFNEEDLLSSAAQVAFFFVFALFPLLLFLVSLFGILLESTDDMRMELFFYLRQVLPGSATDLVQKTIDEVSESSSGGKLTFGIIAALYSASAGIDSTRIALNGVYNLTETRPWWKTKVLSIFLTLILAFLITIALGIIFYGGKFLILVLEWINLPVPSPMFLGVLQTIIVIIVLVSTFALLYNYLPKHKKPSWVWVTPGAIIGIVLWVALSFGFRLYLNYFNTYDKTYGSLGAVIILMLWLYLTALVILLGGSINAVLQEYTDPETAEAGEKKKAAQEVVKDPENNTLASAKDNFDKNKRIPTLAPPPENNIVEQEEKQYLTMEGQVFESEIDSSTTISEADRKKISAKSSTNLIVGTVFGFLAGIFFKKKK